MGAIASGQFQLYQPFFATHKERLNRNITDVWKQVNKQGGALFPQSFPPLSFESLTKRVFLSKEHLPKGKNYLELVAMAEDAEHDDIEVDLPVLRVYYNADKARNHHKQ